MDFRAWIETVWPLPAVVGALEKAADHYVVNLCVLLITCLSAVVLSRRSPSVGWHLNRGSLSATSKVSTSSHASSSTSSQVSASSGIKARTVRLNECVYELYKPLGTPSVQIVFFHGLQDKGSSDVHLSTWQSRDGSCIWPQTWLVDEFPSAHVLSVSYFRYLGEDARDSYSITDILLANLMDAKVGQASDCPVVLVGHSIGGQFIKELCSQAGSLASGSGGAQLKNFRTNMRGIFFYATPHRGIQVAEKLGKYLNVTPILMDNFTTWSRHAQRLNQLFEKIYFSREWLLGGLGETLPTKLGHIINDVIVPEESARHGDEFSARYGDQFSLVAEDHFSICRPRNMLSQNFIKLTFFLQKIDQIASKIKLKKMRDNTASRRNEERSRSDGPNIDRQQDSDDNDWYEDPITSEVMCDPVNCSDGFTYDRWTIVDNRLTRSPYDGNMSTFCIVCDDNTTRSRLFRIYPEQEPKFKERRRKYREEALQHARADPIEFGDAIEKLNNVVKWKPLDVECKMMLVTVLSLVSQQESILDDIPVVNYEDVIGARLESEGARLVMFLGVGYFIIMFSFSMQWGTF
ncbi:unnamed protein product [Calypogeia fissa]